MHKKDYYKILGISSDAKLEDIKKAYRSLVHKCHPDIAGNTPEMINKFKEITEAYEVLSSPQKREQYDSLRRLYEYAEGKNNNSTGTKYTDAGVKQGVDDGVNSGAESNKKSSDETNTSSKKNDSEQKENKKSDYKNDEPKKRAQKIENTFTKMRSEAIFAHQVNVFTAFIKRILKNVQPKQKKYVPPKVDGKDITTEVTLTVEEAINGTERVVNILHMETCEKCRGRKFINGTICPSCGGVGEKSKYKKLTVKIPPHVKHNSKIRVEGEGNKGFNGGKRGNLYLVIKIKNNPELEYDGLNILRTVSIEPFEAVLGGYINFDMNGENIKMKLMPMTYNGQKYRISEQGTEKNGKKGDLIITVKIDIPKKLSKEEIELYEKLKAVSKRTVRAD